jgi:hypothetical protein
MAAPLRLQQQSESRIAADIDPLDRVHLHGDFEAHGFLKDMGFLGNVAVGDSSCTRNPGLPLRGALERDDFSSSRHPAPAPYWSMIFSENRCPLFGIML